MFDFLTDMLGQRGSPHLPCLQEILSRKYTIMLAYIAYGDQLRAEWRDGIYEHFQEHIKNERDDIYQLNKKITALGGDACVTPRAVTSVPLDDTRTVIQALLQMEEELVVAWSDLFHKTSDDVALNAMAQNGALADQQHADDLKRYLRSKG
mgnify:CR=1 FL=1